MHEYCFLFAFPLIFCSLCLVEVRESGLIFLDVLHIDIGLSNLCTERCSRLCTLKFLMLLIFQNSHSICLVLHMW